MPAETLLYFGDTIHMPYGDKSESTIRAYCKGISEFLMSQDCKMIVIACNTASSFGLDVVKEVAGTIPVVNVIDPVVEHIASHFSGSHVGVIGTRGTIGSGVYQRKIHARDPQIAVQSLATPLLAPMVEEGFTNNEIADAAVRHYLQQPELNGIDALILGCTHYPLIRQRVDDFFRGQVEILDSAEIVARHCRRLVEEGGITAPAENRPQHRFYVSDLTPSFQKTAGMFFRESIDLALLNIWNNN